MYLKSSHTAPVTKTVEQPLFFRPLRLYACSTRRPKTRPGFLAVLLALLFSGTAWADESKAGTRVIPLWTYHDYPPFIINREKRFGFSYSFAKILQQYGKGNIEFTLRPAPRKRIDHWLEEGREGIVLWVNPSWFRDLGQEKYRWSGALLQDINEVISRQRSPVRYSGTRSLRGLRFGALLGEIYPSLQSMVEDGTLHRDDVASPMLNLRKLLHDRIDFTIMPRSEFIYLTHDSGQRADYHVSAVPYQRFTRHLLIQSEEADLLGLLEFFDAHIGVDRGWAGLRRMYHMR